MYVKSNSMRTLKFSIASIHDNLYLSILYLLSIFIEKFSNNFWSYSIFKIIFYGLWQRIKCKNFGRPMQLSKFNPKYVAWLKPALRRCIRHLQWYSCEEKNTLVCRSTCSYCISFKSCGLVCNTNSVEIQTKNQTL